MPISKKPGTDIFIADRWKKEELRDSRYVWLPINFEGSDMRIKWQDEWDMSVFE